MLRALLAEDVNTVFAYPGGSIIKVFDALKPLRAVGIPSPEVSPFSGGLLREQRRGVIPVPAVGKERHDHLSLVLGSLRELDRAVQRSTGGDTYGNAFLLREELRRGKSVFVDCLEDLIVNSRVQDIRHKARADSLDLVAACLAL